MSPGLQWDDELNEPYLAHPTDPTLRFTPFREDDLEAYHRHCNIPEIAERRRGVPSPFPIEEAAKRIAKDMARYKPTIETLKAYLTSPNRPSQPPNVLACPLFTIRENSKIIGHVTVRPFEWDPRGLSVEQMMALPLKEQIWSLGWALNPAYQGRGIMSVFCKLLVEEYIKPYMRIGKLECGMETNNPASLALAKRIGYEVVMTIKIPWDNNEEREIYCCFMDLQPKD